MCQSEINISHAYIGIKYICLVNWQGQVNRQVGLECGGGHQCFFQRNLASSWNVFQYIYVAYDNDNW